MMKVEKFTFPEHIQANKLRIEIKEGGTIVWHYDGDPWFDLRVECESVGVEGRRLK